MLHKSDVVRIGKILSGKGVCGVEFTNTVSYPSVDLERRVIRMPSSWQYFFESEVGVMIHEAGHIRFTEHLNLDDLGGIYFDLLNTFEDIRMEDLMVNTYVGAKKFLQATKTEWYAENLKQDFPPHIQFAMACIYEDAGMDGVAFLKNELAQKAWDGTALIRAGARGYKTTGELLEALRKEVFPFFKDDKRTKAKYGGVGREHNSYSDESKKGDTYPYEENKDHYPKLLPEQLKLDVDVSIPQYLATIRKIRDMDVVRHSGASRRGKINTKHLHKLEANDFKIFSERIQRGSANTTVFALLVDLSGSMEYSDNSGVTRLEVAVSSAASFATAATLAKRACLVYGFNSQGVELKTFDRRIDLDELPETAVMHQLDHGGYNCDNVYVDVVVGKLLERKEKNKVLVVLSDGQPTGCPSPTKNHLNHGCDSPESRLSGAIGRARKCGIQVFSIGCQTDTSGYYGDKYSHVCHSLEEVPMAFKKIFDNLIT